MRYLLSAAILVRMDSLLRKCKVCRNFGITYFVLRIHLLVQQFGDIQALHTACKNRGFIMVSYCDIRAAQNAARALQNKLLRGTKLDIRYSISKVFTVLKEDFVVCYMDCICDLCLQFFLLSGKSFTKRYK